MLEELRIQNFAIITQLELRFAPGFNVITGETGAGKSIIIDAVELLLGGRADVGMVRAGAERAIVEGTFLLGEREKAVIVPILLREDLMGDGDGDSLTLTREVRNNGRTSGRVNGISANVELLREIGEALVDIHGQSAHLSLLKPSTHLDLLDRYADLLEVRAALATVVASLHDVRRDIRTLLDDEAALRRRADLLRHEVEEIAAAALESGEDAELASERTRLSNSEQLATLAAEASQLLSGESVEGALSAVDQLMQAAAALGKLAKIDPDMKEAYTLAETLSEQAQDLALELNRYADDIEYNPDRLNEVEERLELITSLKRRYGVTSIEGILEYAEKARAELDNIEHSEERLNALRAKEEQLLRHIGELCKRISRVRQIAGGNLAKRVERELKDLRMENTRFQVEMTQIEDPNGCYVGDKRYAFDASGMDKLEFMMSANLGEPLRPLAKVASGGEAARIMLALKRVLSQADHTPTLIFDEIDQGIGGRVGAVVGEKLWSLALNHQVLCVTHLPQLAGYGDKHYHVQKRVSGERTATVIIPLEDDEARTEELAAMLGAMGEAGKQSARDLLANARDRKAVLQHNLSSA